MPVLIAAFYKFVFIAEPQALRDQLFAHMRASEMRGTLLIASEGINGTVSALPDAMAQFLAMLRSDARFADLETKQAQSELHPFKRLKVKVKKEIITLRVPEADPSAQVGQYVSPEDWNALISDPEVIVLDTRNAYEVAEGTFARAVDPRTRSFGEFPHFVDQNLDPKRNRKVAMFCTGGIRCEKASAYLMHKGFEEVYHLKGGILNYLARVPAEDSLWHGKCFVFDEREAVGEKEVALPAFLSEQ